MNPVRHTSNLFRLTRLAAVNCFFVREDDGLTLVDTGPPGCASAILAAARRLGAPLRRILITHAHGDHVGSLDVLRARLPDVDVLIGAREARLLANDLTLDPQEPSAKLRGFQAVRTQPTRLLQPGERVGSLEAVFSPGHTPGHMAYLDVRDGTLLAGDAFSTAGGLAVAGVMRLLFPLPALMTWDRGLAVRSAVRLRELNPSRLAVGHGRVLESPGPAMDQAIAVAA